MKSVKFTFYAVVSFAFFATVFLHLWNPLWFYKLSMMLQLVTLAGIALDSRILIQTGHLGFAVLIYYGVFTLPYPDECLIYALCLTALVTRRIFHGCIFDITAGDDYTTESYLIDGFYAIPLLIGAYDL